MNNYELSELERRVEVARQAIKEHDRDRDYFWLVVGLVALLVGVLLSWPAK